MSITVIVENDTIKLPVHVPDGTRVEVTLPDRQPTTAPDWLQLAVGTATTGLSTDQILRETRGEECMVLVDANVLLDVVTADPTWAV